MVVGGSLYSLFVWKRLGCFTKQKNIFSFRNGLQTSLNIKLFIFPRQHAFSMLTLLSIHGGSLLSYEKSLAEGRRSLIAAFIAWEVSAKTAFERMIHFLNAKKKKKRNCGTHCLVAIRCERNRNHSLAAFDYYHIPKEEQKCSRV